jgi:hypothetical protein
MKKASLLNILPGGNTVFTFKDILLASGETNASRLRRRINYDYLEDESDDLHRPPTLRADHRVDLIS